MIKTNAQCVADFHRTMGAAMPDRPTFPTRALLSLRERLIDEEHSEVKAVLAQMAAVSAGPEATPSSLELVAKLAHELADLLYVTYGAMLACGVDPDAVFAEVHRANMEKAGGPQRADGKQLKPANWQPADVAGILKLQEIS